MDTTDSRPAIICLLGFTQWSGPGTGLYRLHDRFVERYFDRRTSLVLLRRWNSDHEETAELIRHRNMKTVIAIGYSYGCGHALVQLSKHLGRRAIAIDAAFLIDPVPRYRLLPLKVLSLTRFGKFKVAHNVRSVWSWRQLNARPFGRRVIAMSDQTVVHDEVVFGSAAELKRRTGRSKSVHGDRVINSVIGHNEIDDNAMIHEAIIDRVDSIVAGRLQA